MVLVYRLGVVHRAENVGCVELKNTNDELEEEQDVDQQSDLAMGTLEACLRVRGLVHLNDDQTSNQEAQCDHIQS